MLDADMRESSVVLLWLDLYLVRWYELSGELEARM